jgi:hypothetical protein
MGPSWTSRGAPLLTIARRANREKADRTVNLILALVKVSTSKSRRERPFTLLLRAQKAFLGLVLD